jgi:hypothetical protein
MLQKVKKLFSMTIALGKATKKKHSFIKDKIFRRLKTLIAQ